MSDAVAGKSWDSLAGSIPSGLREKNRLNSEPKLCDVFSTPQDVKVAVLKALHNTIESHSELVGCRAERDRTEIERMLSIC
jgi:hypothetical protein